GVALSHRTNQLLEELRIEFPSFRVVSKHSSWFARSLDFLVRVGTFGFQTSFLDGYVTTIGQTVYVPKNWDRRTDEEKYVTLRHEAIHLRQFGRYGMVVMTFIYLLPILPLGLALGRARLEWEAYAETLRAVAEIQGIEAAMDKNLRAHIVRQFT